MAKKTSAKSAKLNKSAQKAEAEADHKATKSEPKAKAGNSTATIKLKRARQSVTKLNPAQIKHGIKFVFKWVAISAIIFFFVGGTIIAAWMSNRDTQAAKKKREEVQKQYEEAIKKAQEEAANKPKEYDQSLKVDGDITSLQIIDEKTGDGAEVKEGDEFKAKYKVAIASTGEISEKGELDLDPTGVPYKLEKHRLIDGWVEGMIGMKVGGVRVIKMPSEKAYGETGNSSIAPNTDLVFRIELLEVKSGQ